MRSNFLNIENFTLCIMRMGLDRGILKKHTHTVGQTKRHGKANMTKRQGEERNV